MSGRLLKNENRGQALGWNQNIAAGSALKKWMATGYLSFLCSYGLRTGKLYHQFMTQNVLKASAWRCGVQRHRQSLLKNKSECANFRESERMVMNSRRHRTSRVFADKVDDRPA